MTEPANCRRQFVWRNSHVERRLVEAEDSVGDGGTGFVGTYVCRLLGQQNQSAIAFGVEPFTPEALFVLGDAAAATRFVHGDVQDLAALDAICAAAKPDAIIHAAGLVGHDASLANPGRTYAVNVGGTVNVFEAARKANISKVLVISSNAAYHKKTRDSFDETHPTTSIYSGNPNAHYGASKAAAEQVALAYHTFHGMDVVAIRITSVYGFGMKPGQMQLKQIVEGAANGQKVAITSGGHVVRDYTYVEDFGGGDRRYSQLRYEAGRAAYLQYIERRTDEHFRHCRKRPGRISGREHRRQRRHDGIRKGDAETARATFISMRRKSIRIQIPISATPGHQKIR